MRLHESGEDYLEAILILKSKMGAVRGVDIAQYLGVSKPSVSHALSMLCEGGFLIKDQNHYIYLTEKGLSIAEKIYERHRFFKEQLVAAGVELQQAEKEACRLEHGISDESFRKLKKLQEKDASRMIK